MTSDTGLVPLAGQRCQTPAGGLFVLASAVLLLFHIGNNHKVFI